MSSFEPKTRSRMMDFLPSALLLGPLSRDGGDAGKPRNVDSEQFGPKVHFSNERTFIVWLNMSVTIASFSSLVLAFSSNDSVDSQVLGIGLLSVSILFCVYSVTMYYRRSRLLRKQSSTEFFDDRCGPVVLSAGLVVCLSLLMLRAFS